MSLLTVDDVRARISTALKDDVLQSLINSEEAALVRRLGPVYAPATPIVENVAGASGGIGAFHFALKLGIGALFLSLGKSFEEGAEIGLSYAFLSHTMHLVIMLIMGLISIPILAKAREKATNKS